MAALPDPELTEASGLATSAAHSGVLWTHNDDGDDDGVLFAIDTSGTSVGTLTLSGAEPVDWEAVATTTARGTPELWVGDIGDNTAARDSLTLLITAEPASLTSAMEAGVVERVTFTLSEGAADAEAMLVDPASGRLLLFTRDTDESVVYALTPDDTAARPVATLELDDSLLAGFGAVRAADVAADGSVVLRLSDGVAWFPGNGSAVDALAGSPCSVPVPPEADGEGVAVVGSDLYFIGEGAEPTLWRVTRTAS